MHICKGEEFAVLSHLVSSLLLAIFAAVYVVTKAEVGVWTGQ
jgi:hypothetical protein